MEAAGLFMILVEVDGRMEGYIEAHGFFHRIYWWKLQFMEAMEASTSTDSRKFHVLPWKLSLTSTEVNLLAPTSVEFPWK